MGITFECNFNLRDLVKTLDTKEKGRVQQFVTNEVLNLSDGYIPFDEAGKYENPGRLKDSGHIEDGTDVVWQALVLRRRELSGRSPAGKLLGA